MKILFALLHVLICCTSLSTSVYASLNDCENEENIFLIEDDFIIVKKIIVNNCLQEKYITKYQKIISGYNDNYGAKYSSYNIYKMINILSKVKSGLDVSCLNNSCKGIIDIGFTNNNIKNLLLLNYIRDLYNIELLAVTNKQKLKYKSNIIKNNNSKYLLIDSNNREFIAVNSDNLLEVVYEKLGVIKTFETILSYEKIDLWSAYRKLYHLIYRQIDHSILSKMQSQHIYLSGDVCNKFFHVQGLFGRDKSTDRVTIMNLMTRLNNLTLSDIRDNLELRNDNAKLLVEEIILLYVIMKLFNIQKAQCITQDITLDGYIENS